MRESMLESLRAYIEGLNNPTIELGVGLLVMAGGVLFMNLLLYEFVRRSRLLRRTPLYQIFIPTWFALCLALLILIIGLGDAYIASLRPM